MESAESFEIVSCMNFQCGQQLRIPAGEMLQVTCPTCGTSFTYRPPKSAGGQTKGLGPEFRKKAWIMAELMLMIARESMTLIKRNAPAVGSKVTRKQEWEAFIEFLKVLFNLADRVAAFHVPVSEYLQFLDALEDAVGDQMNNAFRKQAGPSYDDTSVKASVSAAFDVGQKFYQSHQFMIFEEGRDRDAYFKKFGETLASTLGSRSNTTIVTTASMCASTSIAAMKALMESADGDALSKVGQA